jgi:hypothetical protein
VTLKNETVSKSDNNPVINAAKTRLKVTTNYEQGEPSWAAGQGIPRLCVTSKVDSCIVTTHHWTQSWNIWMQFIPLHSIFKSVLMLLYRSRLDLELGWLSQYSVWLQTRRPGFCPRYRQRIFPVASVSIPALRPTQPPIQWVPGVLPPEVKRCPLATI